MQEILNRSSRSRETKSTVLATKEDETGTNDLFHLSLSSIKVYDRKQTLAKSEELKMTYKDDEFSTVGRLLLKRVNLTLLFAKVSDFLNEKRRKVEDFQFHVVYDEEADVQKFDRIEENEIEENLKRTKKERKSIELVELFDDRSLKSGSPPEKVKRILLYGNPGTGKTSIGKKIGSEWANDRWGSKFHAVYVLPMRQLDKSSFKRSSDIRERPTIECAIAKFCFPKKRSDEQFETLSKYIEDDLDSESTLVVMDGLDESDDVGKQMLRQVVAKTCNLLLLTRPYNLNEVRDCAQFEVECLGLSETQLEQYVEKEIGTEDAASLQAYLHGNPNVHRFARVPVTANILCSLWKERRINQNEAEFDMSDFALYESMTL